MGGNYDISQGLKFLLILCGVGQNHRLGTKFLVGVGWVNYSECKELHFTRAPDAAKATCAENKQKCLKVGEAEDRGNGFCQFVY